MGIRKQQWGIMSDGTPVELFTMVNGRGMEASIATYGGIVTRLTVPDRNGIMADVVLGYDTLEEYCNDCCYLGCIVGRVANRISGARFILDGTEYGLDENLEKHHIHGGVRGFHARVWTSEERETADGPALVLRYVSADGEQGYPGTLDVSVVYTLIEDGLRMDYRAVTDKPTMVNLTNHAYFNLSGASRSDILDHVLTISGSRYLAMDTDQIPTGQVENVFGTPLDFTSPLPIGNRIDEECDVLAVGQGYDHFFVAENTTDSFRPVARVSELQSGRTLEVCTTQPGVQFYSGNSMPFGLRGKQGAIYGRHSGFCLETQGYTDAPNRSEFPSVVLRPGEVYEHVTEYRFSVT
jgi:aldose 1-epimerase